MSQVHISIRGFAKVKLIKYLKWKWFIIWRELICLVNIKIWRHSSTTRIHDMICMKYKNSGPHALSFTDYTVGKESVQQICTGRYELTFFKWVSQQIMSPLLYVGLCYLFLLPQKKLVLWWKSINDSVDPKIRAPQTQWFEC